MYDMNIRDLRGSLLARYVTYYHLLMLGPMETY